ncbi:TetR-like C-terminal domain-containing protein [Rhodococcus wratislaviensis]|uniref:TetR-like C-terminal domain-containing protein n=1 Tax=Rhodococcus wratislaviensis TaxID=44752 RepID=UPI003656D069
MTRIERVGIANVKVSDVAQDAGVHETSIYRRWKTLPRLLVDALLSCTAVAVPIDDTGCARGDLESFTTSLIRFVQSPTGAAWTRGTLISDTDPVVNEVLRDFWEQRLSAAEVIIQRGKARGEVRSDIDARLVLQLLGGLINFHLLHLGGGIPEDLANRAVSLIFSGVTFATDG